MLLCILKWDLLLNSKLHAHPGDRTVLGPPCDHVVSLILNFTLPTVTIIKIEFGKVVLNEMLGALKKTFISISKEVPRGGRLKCITVQGLALSLGGLQS